MLTQEHFHNLMELGWKLPEGRFHSNCINIQTLLASMGYKKLSIDFIFSTIRVLFYHTFWHNTSIIFAHVVEETIWLRRS